MGLYNGDNVNLPETCLRLKKKQIQRTYSQSELLLQNKF